MERKQDGYLEDSVLKKEIFTYIEQDRYRLTKHADEELRKDDLDLNDALHVLKTGEAILNVSFCRFSGSFEPIFDSFAGGLYTHVDTTPQQKNRKLAKIIPKIDEA